MDCCSVDQDAESERFKLLQDICSSPDQLPGSYWLNDVFKDRRISRGGEATIYKGTHRDQEVVIRALHSVNVGEPDESEQHELMKVCRCFLVVHCDLASGRWDLAFHS